MRDVDRALDVVGPGEQRVDRLEVRRDLFPLLSCDASTSRQRLWGRRDLPDPGLGDDVDDVLGGLVAFDAKKEVDRVVACIEAVAVGE